MFSRQHRPLLLTCLFALAGCASSSSLAPTQTAPQVAASPTRAPLLTPVCANKMAAPQALQNKPGYVEVQVSVTDRAGQDVPNLTKDDFSVSVDNTKYSIEFFQAAVVEHPDVGFLVDTSGSTDSKLSAIKAVIADVTKRLSPDQKAFLIAFANRPFPLQPPTTNHVLVVDKLDQLQANGETALYDSLGVGLMVMSRTCSQAGIIVTVTDGLDSKSQRHAQDIAIEAATQGTRLDFVGIGNTNTEKGHQRSSAPAFREVGDTDFVDAKGLHELAVQSGGSFERVRADADPDTLDTAASRIELTHRVRYTLGFVVPGTVGQPWAKLVIDMPTRAGATVINQPLVPLLILAAATSIQPSDLNGTYRGQIANMNGVAPLILDSESTVTEKDSAVSGDWKTNAATLGTMKGTASGDRLSLRIDRGDKCRGSFEGIGIITEGGRRVRGSLKGRDCTPITDFMFDVSKQPN